MRRWVLFIFALWLVVACFATAQTSESTRKIKTKVVPVEPELARKLRLVATVKIQVTIAPNGTIQQAKAIGGHPLLIGPSLDAAKQFRYEAADSTSTAVIEFHYGAESN